MLPAAHARRKRAGFSLVEMLAALLILSLMTGLVASGVSAGTRMYQQERFESQAQVLAGTIQSTLADPVRFMQKSGETYTLKYEGNSIAFSGTETPLHADDEGRLYLLGTNSGAERVKLLNDGIYGTCKVADLSSRLNATVDAGGEAAYVFEGSYTITGPSGMSKDFAFAIVPQFGVQRDSSASSGSGGSGNGGAGETADKSALADQLSAARSELAAGADKPESAVTAFQNAIEAAQAVYDNANAKQSDVSTQVSELIAARAAFAKASNSSTLNYGGLKTLMDTVDALGTLRRDDQNLVNNLQTAYQNAKTAYDGKTATGQQQIDDLSTALQNALNAYNNGRYTGDLRAAISSANTALQTERVDRDGITAALKNALSNAQAAANSPANYSQAQIDQYTATLQSATTAYNNLEKKSSGGGGDNYDVATDPNAPADNTTPNAKEWALRAGWYGSDVSANEWVTRTDADGVNYKVVVFIWGTNVEELVYYKGAYYLPYVVDNYGQPWEQTQSTPTVYDSNSGHFRVSHLDGGAYKYDWSWVRWLAVS